MTVSTQSKKKIKRHFNYDAALLFPILFLVGFGIVMVYSASSALSLKVHGHGYFYLKRQAGFSLIGIIAMFLCCHFPYRIFRHVVYPLLFLAVGLLVLVLVPGFGVTAGGSTRWLGLAGLTFQPSELARLALVMYLAYSLTKKQAKLDIFSIGFVPHVIVLAVLVVLIGMEPDFGSIVILTILAWIMMFTAGVRIPHLLVPLPVILAAFAYFLISAPYRMARLVSFLNPWAYASDQGYQVVHSQMAFGTGGIVGTGLGHSYQKLFFLPEPHTDFIFSVIGEEVGLVGVTIIVVLYGVIVWRGIGIARHCPDPFGALVALGLTAAIALQVCVNMGVTLGLLPPKGLPLPFLSYGGTSMVISTISMGILMNIGGQPSVGMKKQGGVR
ncbi:MAG: putative lipid II flippase FtsW [Thermodesulfobacteriota bacterium]|nr:putative lipid II flippase FtsW [Thermodesulfobacteriota bacterium]